MLTAARYPDSPFNSVLVQGCVLYSEMNNPRGFLVSMSIEYFEYTFQYKNNKLNFSENSEHNASVNVNRLINNKTKYLVNNKLQYIK